EALKALWRHQLGLLQAAGWQTLQKSPAFGYAYRCPCHAFARDPSGLRPCKNYRVCPFCFGLQVEILYENIVRALHRHREPLDLYLNVVRDFILADHLGDALDLARERQQDLTRNSSGSVGAISRTTVAPTHGQEGMITLRQATLLAYAADGPIRLGWTGQTVKVRSQSKLNLARVAAKLG